MLTKWTWNGAVEIMLLRTVTFYNVVGCYTEAKNKRTNYKDKEFYYC